MNKSTFYFTTGILALLFTTKGGNLTAQNVGINSTGTTPNSSAILEVDAPSSNKGILIPRMSDNDRQNLKNPATGLLIYDTTISELVVYNGTGWQGISASQVSTSSGAGYAAGPGIAINTSGNKPDPSAALDVASTTKGVLIPRTASVASPTNGLMIYNTTTNTLDYYNGSAWISPCASTIDNHHGTGANTAEGIAINATGAVANASAILDISSANQGLLIPELTSNYRDMLPTPATGLLIYNTDDKNIEYWTGTAWDALSGASWTQLSLTAGPSNNRETHSAVWDSADGIMLVFGGDNGVSSPYTVYNDLWSYAPSTNTWALLTANGATGSPPKRTAACAVWDNTDGEMLLFSGTEGCGGGPVALNDIWGYKLSTHTWTQFNPPSPLPVVRYGSSAVWDPTDKIMLMYAGAWNGGRDDLWAYSPSANTWTQLSITGGPTFNRDTYQAVWDPTDHLMWIFQGNNNGTIFHDLWSYSPSTATWKQYTTTQPPGRAYYSAVWNPASKSILMFGGWNWHTLYNDLWSYTPSTNTWEQISTCGTVPSARGAHTAVMDITNNIMYMYGGSADQPEQCGTTLAGDFWEH